MNRAASVIVLRDTKTKLTADVAVVDEVLELLPDAAPDAWLFPSMRSRAGHATRSGALRSLRKAIAAIGIQDPDRLDTHSFRRGVVSTLERNGVGDGVGMLYTGHETRSIYQRLAAGSGLAS